MKTTYQLTDHLGNVRSTFNRNGDMLSKSDYYPFGWQKPGRQVNSGEKYRYGYQGEYAEEDEETGWNQFELRLWDSRIGRWMSTDPAGQFHSPYLGMGNNPVFYSDTKGDTIKVGYLRLAIDIPNLTPKHQPLNYHHTVIYHIDNHTNEITWFTEAGEDYFPSKKTNFNP